MSNIERRYAYYDTGVLPEEGEYGVTYLTLYSSNAGNVYDGWVWDPENKVPESLTERTYGYRNPDYPDYCWDDEVVVDLSNAQNRQESSEFAQGRITSFNTNVSSRPIILQDIDITGLTEEEREERATTVLFCAIPLVQDAYIQAQVEVQCKCNLSPDNTSGEMRVEAFYILNDESDRTMRPNPVHTFSVTSDNERHTLPWLYWNPALRHEDHNYIGVKLIATGGTVEIGISDDPDYGDAMITLASAGLTGDHIDGGKPLYLEIFGKEEVVGGYRLDPDDYTVLCTYDTGEIYDVTRMCDFNPAMGSQVTEALTTLTASYMGLHASMVIRLGMVESIELMGRDTFHSELMLKMSDFTVLAYLDTGDIAEVTNECTFSPAMGTTISSSTTLVANFEPYWMSGSSFTASLEIEKIGEQLARVGGSTGLIYTLYDDGPDSPAYVEITGSSLKRSTQYEKVYDYIDIRVLSRAMRENSIDYYNIEWNAEGPISGVAMPYVWQDNSYKHRGFVSNFINFDDVRIVPEYDVGPLPSHLPSSNHIIIWFEGNETITSDKLSFLLNIDMRDVNSTSLTCLSRYGGDSNDLHDVFKGCKQLDKLDFLKNIDTSRVNYIEGMFDGCEYLEDISGIKDWDVSNVLYAYRTFKGCKKLTNASDLYKWYMPKLHSAASMFEESGLTTCSGLGNMKMGEHNQYGGRVSYGSMFQNCKSLKRLNGLEHLNVRQAESFGLMFSGCEELEDISALSNWLTTNLKYTDNMFSDCIKLSDISPLANWDTSELISAKYMFNGCMALHTDGYVNRWNMSKIENLLGMFAIRWNDAGDDTNWNSRLLWPDYESRVSDVTITCQTKARAQDGAILIEINHRTEEKWTEPGGLKPYYSISGMYGNRDVVRLTFSSLEPHWPTSVQWVNINCAPWWYRSAIEYKLLHGEYYFPF